MDLNLLLLLVKCTFFRNIFVENEYPEKLLESKVLSFQTILCLLCTDNKLNGIVLNTSTLGKLLSR